MILKTKYPTFEQAMKYWQMQAQSSLEHAAEDYPCGSLRSAGEVWQALRPRVTYRDDPEGTELFQSYQTLFYDNHHGHAGAGDCDCFALATLAVCTVNRLRCQIVLAGRSRKWPVHIYNIVEGRIFDLTQPKIDLVKKYPYLQTLNVKLIY
jgi:hypothetical protein